MARTSTSPAPHSVQPQDPAPEPQTVVCEVDVSTLDLAEEARIIDQLLGAQIAALFYHHPQQENPS